MDSPPENGPPAYTTVCEINEPDYNPSGYSAPDYLGAAHVAEKKPLSSDEAPPEIQIIPVTPSGDAQIEIGEAVTGEYETEGSATVVTDEYTATANEAARKPVSSYESEPLINPPIVVQPGSIQTEYVDAAGSVLGPSKNYADLDIRPHFGTSQSSGQSDLNAGSIRVTIADPGGYPMDGVVWEPWGGVKEAEDKINRRIKPGRHCRYFIAAVAYITAFICSGIVSWYKNEEDKYNRKLLTMSYYYDSDKKEYKMTYMLAGGLLIGAVLVIFMEGCTSPAARSLRRMKDLEYVVQMIDSVKEQAPKIVWEVECFHYAEYNKTPPVPGSQVPKPPDYLEREDRVVTHQERRVFRYRECEDLTGPHDNYPSGVMTKISVGHAIGFKNRASYDWFVKCREEFYAESQNKDHYIDTDEFVVIDGTQTKLTVSPRKGATACCMNQCCLCLCLLTWWAPIYRWVFFSITEKKNKIYTKIINV